MSNSQTGNTDPLFITRNPAQGLGNDAADARHGLGALGAPGPGSSYGFTSCVMPGPSPGDGQPADLEVTAAGGMSVTVKPGGYQMDRGAAIGPYFGALRSAVTVTHPTASSSNPRYDYVVLRDRDPDSSIDGDSVTDSAKIIILSGSPSANPSEPIGQMTSGDMVLARVLIPRNASSVGAIDDRRLFGSARGGIYPRSASDDRSGAYQGVVRYDPDTGEYHGWNGSQWSTWGSIAPWVRFTPALYSAAGQCSLGNGGIAEGSYQVIGKTLRVRYYFEANRPCNLGNGAVYTYLPPGFYAAVGITGVADQHGRCQLNTEDDGYQTWIGDAGIYSGANKVYPSFPLHAATSVVGGYVVAGTQGGVATGVPKINNGYPDPTRGLGINLEIEIE